MDALHSSLLSYTWTCSFTPAVAPDLSLPIIAVPAQASTHDGRNALVGAGWTGRQRREPGLTFRFCRGAPFVTLRTLRWTGRRCLRRTLYSSSSKPSVRKTAGRLWLDLCLTRSEEADGMRFRPSELSGSECVHGLVLGPPPLWRAGRKGMKNRDARLRASVRNGNLKNADLLLLYP